MHMVNNKITPVMCTLTDHLTQIPGGSLRHLNLCHGRTSVLSFQWWCLRSVFWSVSNLVSALDLVLPPETTHPHPQWSSPVDGGTCDLRPGFTLQLRRVFSCLNPAVHLLLEVLECEAHCRVQPHEPSQSLSCQFFCLLVNHDIGKCPQKELPL